MSAGRIFYSDIMEEPERISVYGMHYISDEPFGGNITADLQSGKL